MKRLLLVLKFGSILFITLLLLLPMARIRELIKERQALRDQVMADVARSDAGAQSLTGPLLIVPYTRTLTEQQLDSERRPVTVTREVTDELRLLPELLDVNGELRTEERRRGIYNARLYRADTHLTGRFDVPVNYGITDDLASYRFGRARLVLELQQSARKQGCQRKDADLRLHGAGIELRHVQQRAEHIVHDQRALAHLAQQQRGGPRQLNLAEGAEIEIQRVDWLPEIMTRGRKESGLREVRGFG